MKRTKRRSWIVAGALAAFTGIAVLLLVSAAGSPAGGPARHTKSNGSFLLDVGKTEQLWAKMSFAREVWIAPDGSGRIRETYGQPTFPAAGGEEAWISQGRPTVAPVSGAFAPGKLAYVSLDAASRDAQELGKSLAAGASSPGEILERVSIMLTETVPPKDLGSALVGAVVGLPGVLIEHGESTTTLVGSLADPSGTSITLVLDTGTGSLVSERRIATRPIAGLSVSPPIEVLVRRFTLSELVDNWPVQ